MAARLARSSSDKPPPAAAAAAAARADAAGCFAAAPAAVHLNGFAFGLSCCAGLAAAGPNAPKPAAAAAGRGGAAAGAPNAPKPPAAAGCAAAAGAAGAGRWPNGVEGAAPALPRVAAAWAKGPPPAAAPKPPGAAKPPPKPPPIDSAGAAVTAASGQGGRYQLGRFCRNKGKRLWKAQCVRETTQMLAWRLRSERPASGWPERIRRRLRLGERVRRRESLLALLEGVCLLAAERLARGETACG